MDLAKRIIGREHSERIEDGIFRDIRAFPCVPRLSCSMDRIRGPEMGSPRARTKEKRMISSYNFQNNSETTLINSQSRKNDLKTTSKQQRGESSGNIRDGKKRGNKVRHIQLP